MFSKDKKENKDVPDQPGARFGAYGVSAQPFEIQWKNAKIDSDTGRPWKDSRANRLAIRTFSRGVLGALAFAGMGWYARGNTATNKGFWRGMGEYDPLKPGSMEWKKPLTVIAKVVDTVIGKPISYTIHAITGDAARAERWVRFRPSAKEFSGVNGRSLGSEVVGVTADFAAMSIGDALGRDLVDLADPNLKKPWRDEEGHLSAGKALKSMAKTGWRYVSYNAGEDWAVALPYVYFMRTFKHGLGAISPGFRYDSDRNLNGGSLKIDSNSNVIGNYNRVGIVDLQARFTAYNMGTLLYREWYNWAADRWWHKTPTRLYGAPDAPVETKDRSIAGNAAYLAKWVARGVIKGGVYMTPAVPFFWITRTPQSKYKGMFIDPETREVLGYLDPKDSRPQAVHANEVGTRYDSGNHEQYFSSRTKVFRNRYSRDIHNWEQVPGAVPAVNPHKNPSFDAYAKHFGAGDALLNGIGCSSNYIRKKFHHFPNELKRTFNLKPGQKDFFENPSTFWEYKRNSDRYWNAAVSYTPYFMAKTEFANMWDTGKTDLATERLIDGAASLNWGEFKAGAGELWASLTGKPFADPAREVEALRRIIIDPSSADEAIDKTEKEVAAKEAEQKRDRLLAQKKNAAHVPAIKTDDLPWHNRVFSGPKPDTFAQTVGGKPISHSEREEMRKLLEEIEPPTSSRH
ncbi:MAG: hypothetical protein KGI29_00920 [Pseudomonadota bacterium]|nr:hypothetical protein [Pseudomonadota bacterium]